MDGWVKRICQQCARTLSLSTLPVPARSHTHFSRILPAHCMRPRTGERSCLVLSSSPSISPQPPPPLCHTHQAPLPGYRQSAKVPACIRADMQKTTPSCPGATYLHHYRKYLPFQLSHSQCHSLASLPLALHSFPPSPAPQHFIFAPLSPMPVSRPNPLTCMPSRLHQPTPLDREEHRPTPLHTPPTLRSHRRESCSPASPALQATRTLRSDTRPSSLEMCFVK